MKKSNAHESQVAHPASEVAVKPAGQIETNSSKVAQTQYVAPEIRSEKVGSAGLQSGGSCNGMTAGGRKAETPCTILMS
ncbi:MAG TPA: hypothetical protein PLZ57_06390 [Pseudobdellovibrionaceae bacterium]|nr:hypothetical protein [Pseudobdellovibrionaceae bacterium]